MLLQCTSTRNIDYTKIILASVYEFFVGTSCKNIHNNLCIFTHAITDWWQYVANILVSFIETTMKKIGVLVKQWRLMSLKLGKESLIGGHFIGGQ